MRIDSRKNNEIRSVSITPEYVVYPEGSVLIGMGKTKVLCNTTVDDELPHWMQRQEKPGGWITSEYALLPRSTHSRTKRETRGLKGRTQEIRRLIGRCLRAAVDLKNLGPRTLIIDCDVIQADGGTRTAAITGGYISMIIALNKLIQQNTLSENVLKSAVAAISVGLVDDLPMLDLCYQEDSTAGVDINVAMNSKGEFIEVQGTAEGSCFTQPQLLKMLNLAYKGIGELFSIQKGIFEDLKIQTNRIYSNQ